MKLTNISNSTQTDLRKKGIYKIFTIENKKIYIGSTFHKDGINKRLNEHFRLLHKNSHHSKILQHYYNKYGRSSLKVELVEEILNKDILIEREQYWIDFYLEKNVILFNISKTAKPALTVDFLFRHKKVYKFSKNGDFIKIWNSIKECEEEIGCGKGTISGATTGLMKTYKGFVYQSTPQFIPLTYIKNKTHSKKIKCINDQLIYKSLSEASIYYKIGISTISNSLRKNLRNKKNLKFEYV